MKIESIMIDIKFYTALKYTNYLTLIHFDLIFFLFLFFTSNLDVNRIYRPHSECIQLKKRWFQA